MIRKWGQQGRWAQTRAGWQADLVVRSCLGGTDFMDMTRPHGPREASFRTERCARGRTLLLSFLGCTARPGAQTPPAQWATEPALLSAVRGRRTGVVPLDRARRRCRFLSRHLPGGRTVGGPPCAPPPWSSWRKPVAAPGHPQASFKPLPAPPAGQEPRAC